MEADRDGERVLVLDGVDAGRARGACECPVDAGAAERRGELGVAHVDTCVEVRREVVLGARADIGDRPVRAAVAQAGDRALRRQVGACRAGTREGADRVGPLCTAGRVRDQRGGGLVVVDRDVAAVDRGPPLARDPDVVVGRVHRPASGQLDLGAGAIDAVERKAVAQRVADAELGGAGWELGVAEVTQRAYGIAGLRLEVAAGRSVEPQAGGRHPADLVGRMTVDRRAGHRVAVVAAAGVVDCATDHRRAPGLVDTPVHDDVRVADRVLVGKQRRAAADHERVAVGGLQGGDPGGVDRDRAGQGADEAGIDDAQPPRLFERHRRREAVAEVRRIGRDAPAAVTGVFRVGGEVGDDRRRVEVEERRRQTQRKARELDEAAVGVDRLGGRRVTGVADREVGPQGAPLGLLTGVDRDQRPGAVDVVGVAGADVGVAQTGVLDVGAEERRLRRVLTVVVVVLHRAHIRRASGRYPCRECSRSHPRTGCRF